MTKYLGNTEGTWFTDGCGCYTPDGKCYCAECYYYGSDSVNCGNAGASVADGLVPYEWNVDLKKFCKVNEK